MLRDEKRSHQTAAHSPDGDPSQNRSWCRARDQETQYAGATPGRASILSRPARRAGCLEVFREAALRRAPGLQLRNPIGSPAPYGAVPENPAAHIPQSALQLPTPPSGDFRESRSERAGKAQASPLVEDPVATARTLALRVPVDRSNQRFGNT